MQHKNNIITNALLGIAIGDALGVPVEFLSRKHLQANPITDMIGFGTHKQPKGTWSDDTSFSLCLAESLCEDFDLKKIAQNFVKWLQESHWTAHNEVFDIGGATSKALHKIINGTSPLESGGASEMDNGNGALMRILPLAFYLKDFEINFRFEKVLEVSSITHSHLRSVLGCFIYTEICIRVLKGDSKKIAYYEAVAEVNEFIAEKTLLEKERTHYKRVLDYCLEDLTENDIYSSGYVVHSLEAALWCWLKENSFEQIVLRAVNLGEDTDTTAAIAGGLAGLVAEEGEIPQTWLSELAKREEIMALADTLFEKYC